MFYILYINRIKSLNLKRMTKYMQDGYQKCLLKNSFTTMVYSFVQSRNEVKVTQKQNLKLQMFVFCVFKQKFQELSNCYFITTKQ